MKKETTTDDWGTWKKIIAESEHPEIFVCRICNKHHFHILRIMRVRYAQCGDCKEIYKL